MEKLLLTTTEAAQILGTSRCGIYKLINSGELHSIKVGNNRRIPSIAAHEYVNRKLEEAKAAVA